VQAHLAELIDKQGMRFASGNHHDVCRRWKLLRQFSVGAGVTGAEQATVTEAELPVRVAASRPCVAVAVEKHRVDVPCRHLRCFYRGRQ